jgi:hypothetical protein
VTITVIGAATQAVIALQASHGRLSNHRWGTILADRLPIAIPPAQRPNQYAARGAIDRIPEPKLPEMAMISATTAVATRMRVHVAVLTFIRDRSEGHRSPAPPDGAARAARQ